MSKFTSYISSLSHEDKEVLFYELMERLKENDNERMSMEKVVVLVSHMLGIHTLNYGCKQSRQVLAKILICKACQRMGYRNKEIAQYIGLSKGAIQHYERVFRNWMSSPQFFPQEVKYWNQLKTKVKLCD